MTRRTLLVPLFAAAFILAPTELSGRLFPPPAAGSAAILAALDPTAGGKPALPAGSSADAGRTGFYRWSASIHREALGPQDRSA